MVQITLFTNNSHIRFILLIGEASTHRPGEPTSPLDVQSTTEGNSTNSTQPTVVRSGRIPVERGSGKEDDNNWMTDLRMGLIIGGFIVLLCIIAIAFLGVLG